MPVLVYDGDCGFCRRWCRFIQRNARAPLTFMTFEEARAAGLLASLSAAGLRAAAHYIDNGREYHAGTAATRALRLLPMGDVFALLDLPGVRLLRDLGYAFVAANRDRLGFCAPRDVA